MPLTPLSHGKLNLSHMMGCKYGCELAEKNTTVHIGVRKSCLSEAMMLLLEGQTEEGLFSMSTFFMK